MGFQECISACKSQERMFNKRKLGCNIFLANLTTDDQHDTFLQPVPEKQSYRRRRRNPHIRQQV